MRRSKFSHILLLIGFFVLSLVYFVVNGSWYDPAVLQIKGEVSDLPTGFDVLWDSGSGYNQYENFKVKFLTKSTSDVNTHRVKISYLDKKNSASLSKDIVSKDILVDGKKLPFSEGVTKNSDISSENTLRLSRPGAEVEFKVAAKENISIELLTNTSSGIVRVEVDDFVMEKDLYIANVEIKSWKQDFWLINSDNQFIVTFNIPRYKIGNLKILKRNDTSKIVLNSVQLLTEQGEQIASLHEGSRDLSTLIIPGIIGNPRKYLSRTQIVLQVFFALITTWLVSALYRLCLSAGSLRALFSGKRAVFWGFFLGACSGYLVWLLMFWPGIFSIDSLKIWRAAQLPEVFLNDHPILNVFLYSYLYNIWNNSAIVPLFHILAMSLLTAWIFYTLYRYRVALLLLFPLYMFVVLSIPIGLYNTVLWKDIPFALLIVFWAFTSAMLFLRKQSGSVGLSAEQITALVLLLLSLGLIRHNGLTYLVFIPILYLALGIIRIRKTLWLILGGIVVLAATLALILKNSAVSDSGFLFTQGKMYLQSLFNSSLQTVLVRSWNNYWGILDINQTESKWDLWHYYLSDRSSYSFLQQAGWNDVYPYVQKGGGLLTSIKDVAMRVYWASYETPAVYLTWNPVWGLFLFLVCIVASWWLPLSAIFSAVILVQIFTLVTLLNVLNWRYYYFVCLACYFIIPMICLDIARIRSRKYNEI